MSSTPPDALAANQLTLRAARPEDLNRIIELLPQLADFDIPEQRQPQQLWQGDAALATAILTGENEQSFIHLAVTEDDQIGGFVIITLRPEMLSEAPSAHLETIIVGPQFRGIGLGRRLLQHTESEVRARGAGSLTLHVFRRNERAHSLYQSFGFDDEMIRAIKWLD
ncbi:MAG TPA: hypothetical protein DER02_03825 [Gammaproteobacteria bacterium]|nr:hypothetical protein [Gammaproteobacteria bacterium]